MVHLLLTRHHSGYTIIKANIWGKLDYDTTLELKNSNGNVQSSVNFAYIYEENC